MLASTLERHHLVGFRQQLSTRAAALERRLADARSEAKATAEAGVHDTKDQASTEAAGEVTAAELARERAELSDITLALARIDVGTYGMCSDCGRSIGRSRLKAYPTAKRCHDCQERHERHARQSGG